MSLVCLSSANCLLVFLCIIFRRGFLLGWQPCRPIWCSVRHMVWALTDWPPTPSTSAAMPAALIRLFPKHIWSWPPCCSSVSGSWQSSYSLRHLYIEQQFFFSDPQRVLCYEVPCWTSSDQYERVRAITPNLTHLLPIHTWDLVTLTSHMTPGRENG